MLHNVMKSEKEVWHTGMAQVWHKIYHYLIRLFYYIIYIAIPTIPIL